MATRNGKPDRKRKATSPPKHDLIRPFILYPELTVCGIEIPEEGLQVTARDAKDLLGWESESEYEARLTTDVSPGVASKMKVKYGAGYDLIDYNGEKVRCSNNIRNRPLNLGWVQQLTQDILNQKWRFNGESWVIGTTGMALSLQHRAIALIWAQQMVDYDGKDGKKKRVAAHWQKRHSEPLFIEALMVRGVKETPDVIRTLDHVRPRSASDVRHAVSKIPKDDQEANDLNAGTENDVASKLKASASYMTWHKNNTPARYENKFLKGLTYPSHGEYGEYPYPFYDTGIEVTAMVLNPNPWDEDDMPEEPFQVRGTLLIRPSPFGGFQCFVIGTPTDRTIPKGHDGDETNYGVDPETVQPLPDKRTKTKASKSAKRVKR